MSEPPDDTPQPADRSRPGREEKPRRSYYDDDATGYDIYDPADDEEKPDAEQNGDK